MIKKKFLPVLSTTSPSNLSRNPQPSKPKNVPAPDKKVADSSLENIYRLPSSLKRTEDMINQSILQRQISSTILDIVGNTFRVKNASPSQGQYFYSPTNFSQFLKYKEYASSEFLDTLYEVDGEESSENSIQLDDVSEALELSICDQETRRGEDTSFSLISRTYSSSFSQTLNKTTSHSALITMHDKQISRSSLVLNNNSGVSTQMPLSAGRTKGRNSDPWKQIKEALASKDSAYGLMKNVKKEKLESSVEINPLKQTPRSEKKATSTIQRELLKEIERLERKVKKFTEKENVASKQVNKMETITKQQTLETEQDLLLPEEKKKENNTTYFTEQNEEGQEMKEMKEMKEPNKMQENLEGECKSKGEEVRTLQQNKINTENKLAGNKVKSRGTKSLSGFEKSLKLNKLPNTQAIKREEKNSSRLKVNNFVH